MPEPEPQAAGVEAQEDAVTVARTRIHYVANVRLPSERANAYQILLQCDALLARGAEVSILAPKRLNRFRLADKEVSAYYGLRRPAPIERLFSLDAIDRVPPALQRLPFLIQSATFAFAVRRRLAGDRAEIVYSRDPWTVALLTRDRAPAFDLYYEVHDLPQNEARKRQLLDALRRCRGVVAITEGLRQDVIAGGVPPDQVCVLPDGYDPARFSALPTRDEARAKLGLPLDRSLAVYTGHLFPWKGAHVLVEAAARSDRFDAVLVGGREEDRRRIAQRVRTLGAKNVREVPPVPPADVPAYLAAADVLVLPNSGKERISARYTSPLKLFEYMAAGRPIVASDLPSIGEILTDQENAVLAAADDPQALCRAIEGVLADPVGAGSLAARAAKDALQYTWDARADAILRFVVERGRDMGRSEQHRAGTAESQTTEQTTP